MRTHGPLDPTDTQILEPLSFLPEDKKEKIIKSGGIAKLLVNSGHFAMQGNLVCPIEELGMLAASVSTDSARQNQSNKASEVGMGRHESGKDKPPDDPGKAKVTDNATTPSPFAQKSSLSGLLSGGGSRQDYHHQRPQNNGKAAKAQLEEASSKRNTSALVPKVGEAIAELSRPGPPNNVVDDIRRAQLRKLSEEKQKEKESEEKLKKARMDSGNVTSSDRDSRASSRDSRPSSMEKSSKSSKSKDKSSNQSNKDTGSSVKDSGSSDEKRKKVGKDPSSAKDTFDLQLKGFDKVSARKGMEELSIGGSLRANSKDSSRSSSSSGSSGRGPKGQNEDLARRDMFSPTSSMSSVSSSESSSGVTTPFLPPTAVEAKKPKNKKAKKGKAKADDLSSQASKSGTGTRNATVAVQTDAPLMTDQWVMTDTLPPVESYRDRYEKATKEKKDLQEKLERSEDQRFKLQKTHKREIEQLMKQSKLETKEVRPST